VTAAQQGLRHWAFAACAGLAFWLVMAPGPAAAQPRAEAERREPAGAMISERAFRRFEALTDLYTDGRYREALAAVDAYLGAELNDYERALGEQMRGYVLVALERLDEATRHFEEALRLDALPGNAHFSTMKSLAQLYAATGRWRDAVDTLSRYLGHQAEPAPEDGVLMARNLVELGRHRDALPWVRNAIAAAGGQAPESWHQLELAIHFETEDYRRALNVLAVLVARWPDRLRYWEMMAGAHQELGQQAEALAALLAAYHGGLVIEEPKILNLVRMSLRAQSPYLAGRILQRAIDEGRVAASASHLELLLQAWIAAREYDRAAAVVERLAPMTGNGELHVQQARLAMEQGRWQDSLEAARRGLELGRVSSPGGAWLIVGIALLELGQLRESGEAFQRAQQFDEDSRRQAREWQRFVEERLQLAELR
jgi:tetratricopeptide (TPR) repeat protein